MNWDEVFKIIVAAVGSIGGVGVIIAFIVKLAANHISDKMLKKYDAKMQKDLEEYKHSLEIETEKFRRRSENLTFVTKKQFETEFSAYQKIFDYLFLFSATTSNLFPIMDYLPYDEEEKKKVYQERYSEFCDAYKNYSEVLEKNAPFIPEEHYEMFRKLRQQANELGAEFFDCRLDTSLLTNETIPSEMRKNYKNSTEFSAKVTEAKNLIRDYLSTLKVDKE